MLSGITPLFRRTLFIAAMLVLPAVHAYGQDASRYTMVLRDLSMDDALEHLVATTEMNLLYDPSLLGNARVFCTARQQSAEDILNCIVRAGGLDYYRLSSGTYVLVQQAREAPSYGNVTGIVIDAHSGEPLPYASVYLADASMGTMTNEAGYFNLSDVLPGQHRIITSYLGYAMAVDSVLVPAGEKVRHRVGMEMETLTIAPIVVNGLQQRVPSAGLDATEADLKGLGAPAASGGHHVLQATQQVMGVTLRSPLADLHIQGGEGSEHQFELDGVPVYHPVSLGQMLGAFSPLAIGRMTVQKAGFGVSHGSQVSGLVQAEHALGGTTRPRLILQADPLSFNGRAGWQWTTRAERQVSMMAAFRTSLWANYQAPMLRDMLRDWNAVDPIITSRILQATTDDLNFEEQGHASAFEYSDAHLAARVRLNALHSLYASAYLGENTISTESLTAETHQSTLDDQHLFLTKDRYRWTNRSVQVRHEWVMGARLLSTFRVQAAQHKLVHGYLPLSSGIEQIPGNLPTSEIESQLRSILATRAVPDDEAGIRQFAAKAHVDYSASARHQMMMGVEAAWYDHQFEQNSPFYNPIALSADNWQLAAFVQDRWTLTQRLQVEGGVRLTFIPERKRTVYAEPRLAARYDVGQSRLGAQAFRVSMGLFRQFTQPFNLSNAGPSALVPSVRFWLPVDRQMAPPTAYHVTGAWLLLPSSAWRIQFESYYKHLARLQALDYNVLLHAAPAEAEAIAESDGHAYGGGVQAAYAGNRWRGSAGYEYSVSVRRFPSRFDERLVPTPWEEPHRLSGSLGYRIGGGFTAGLHLRGVWGRTWGYRQAYYDFLVAHSSESAFGSIDLERPEDHVLPALLQVNASLAYERHIGGVAVQARLDGLNVLNRTNVIDWSLRRVASGSDTGTYQRVARALPGFYPVVSLRIGV